MKRIPILPLVLVLLAFSSLASSQSLGEVARRQRQAKKPASAEKVYTNENLPTSSSINVVGAEPKPAAEANDNAANAPGAKSPDAKPEGERAADAKTGGNPASADPARLKAEFTDKAAGLKKDIAQLERELDILNREFRLRAATYYADAGNSLRDPKKWAEQQREHDALVAGKQKALNEAKQKFADLQEQARRAGVQVE